MHYDGWNKRFDEWINSDVIIGLASDEVPKRCGRSSTAVSLFDSLVGFYASCYVLCCCSGCLQSLAKQLVKIPFDNVVCLILLLWQYNNQRWDYRKWQTVREVHRFCY